MDDSHEMASVLKMLSACSRLGISDAQAAQNLAAGKNQVGHDYCCECEKCTEVYGPPPSQREIDQFMREWDEGKHRLSPEEERALEKASVKFKERLKKI